MNPKALETIMATALVSLPLTVQVWTCGNCKTQHEAKKDADACCVCSKCKTKAWAGTRLYGRCGYCCYPAFRKRDRSDLAYYQGAIRDIKKRLEQGRPLKGSQSQ